MTIIVRGKVDRTSPKRRTSATRRPDLDLQAQRDKAMGFAMKGRQHGVEKLKTAKGGGAGVDVDAVSLKPVLA